MRRTGRGRTVVALSALLLAIGVGPSEGRAQVGPPGAAAVDSTQLRIQQRLEILARGLNSPDTVTVVDSTGLRRLTFSAPVVTFPSDPFLDSLLALPGFEPTEYAGRQALFENFPSGAMLRLYGSAGVGDSLGPDAQPVRAMVVTGGSAIRADSTIEYDERSGRGAAWGRPLSSQEGQDPLESDVLYFDMNALRATALGARTVYRVTGTEWRLVGDIPYYAEGMVFGNGLLFTTCDEDEPHYNFSAHEIKIHAGDVLVARNVTLSFAGVPVLWLPFIAQSTKRGRHSGLLTPRFSVNDIVRTSGGYRRRIQNLGFYLAASQYADAQLAFEWFSGEYKSLTGTVGYSWARQFLNGSGTYRQFWREGGSKELTFSTSNRWEPDEDTNVSLTASFASSTSFVRRNTFDPLEATRSIDSQGGVVRSFGWGSVSLGVNRNQFLSDDRVQWLLPSLSVNPRTITLFDAPQSTAGFFNNAALTLRGSFRREFTDLPVPTDTVFSFSQLDNGRMSQDYSASLGVGGFTVSNTLRSNQRSLSALPDSFFPATVEGAAGFRDFSQTDATYTGSLSRVVSLGIATLTPNVSITQRLFRSDTIADARSFVSAPRQLTFAADLRTDLYGIFPGIGPLVAIRHKLTPNFSYRYSPPTIPTPLQAQVFGARNLRKQSQISFGLNQTFEGKRSEPEMDSAAAAAEEGGVSGAEAIAIAELLEQQAADSIQRAQLALPPESTPARRPSRGLDDTGLTRPPQLPTSTLFAINTNVFVYDLVEADSTGRFIDGFQTTTMSNSIRSDLFRGLQLQVQHDLFDVDPETDERIFSLHLSRLNASFNLDSNSTIMRFLGLGSSGGGPPPEPLEGEESTASSFDSMVPDAAPGLRSQSLDRAGGGTPGQWNIGVSYSLLRPRNGPGLESQTLGVNMSLNPTVNWRATWNTSYDVTNGVFSDHSVSLIRDLHRWQAEFGFLQTASGNWSFTFQVALTDNRDLQFDYQQRNLQGGTIQR